MIARLKAESETNSVLKFLVNRFSRLEVRAETRFTRFREIGEKTTELEFWTFWAVAPKRRPDSDSA